MGLQMGGGGGGGAYNQTKKSKKAFQNKLYRSIDQNTFLLAFLGFKTS